MIAAIYARKSTEQHGVAADQTSVARQLDHARQFATEKGWTVDEAQVYVDDGISGAEFAKRPGFLRLMNALKPRPPFQALVMAEESRLGRETIETAYALKQLVTAGVRVFYYMQKTERTLGSATDKVMLSLTAFADELEREKTRLRVTDAMRRKARAGHVCGGRVFGYDNVEVLDAAGRRSHVERRINEGEAAVVRRIFALSADGVGQVAIAKSLNAEGAVAPRSQQARPRSWAPSSVHEILYRELYRGVIVWNKTQKRNAWGQCAPTSRPEREWLRLEAPALQIVSDAQWAATHRRLGRARAEYDRVTQGQRRPHRDRDSKYRLPGFARCGLCGGGLHVRSRSHGTRRAFFYACTSHYNRGPAACAHVDQWPMDEIDAEVIATIDEVLCPGDREIVDTARLLFEASARPDRLDQVREELAALEREQARIADAIASSAQAIPVLMARLNATEATRRALMTELAQTAQRPVWRDLERWVRQSLTDWRSLLTGNVAQARQAFRQGLVTPLKFTPCVDHGYRALRFEGQIGLHAVFGGELVTTLTKMASLTGTGLNYQPVCRGLWRSDRRAA